MRILCTPNSYLVLTGASVILASFSIRAENLPFLLAQPYRRHVFAAATRTCQAIAPTCMRPDQNDAPRSGADQSLSQCAHGLLQVLELNRCVTEPRPTLHDGISLQPPQGDKRASARSRHF